MAQEDRKKRLSDDFVIGLGGQQFDPAETAEPDPAADAAVDEPIPRADSGPPDTRLVQFVGPLTADEIARIRKQYGLALTAYVPNYTYVERIAPAVRSQLMTDPSVRAVAPYLPEYKLSPDLAAPDLRKDDEMADDETLVDISLFDRGDPEAVRAVLQSTGIDQVAVLDDRPFGGLARVRFVAPDGFDFAVLAALDDVRLVEPGPRIVDDNVAAASAIQGGSAANASVWAKGLHGEGQVISVMDSSPIDINHCFFSDVAPNTPGPGHRKLLAQRNASAAIASGHATFVAGCAAGDDRNNSGTHARRGGAWAAQLVGLVNGDVRGAMPPSTLLAELNAAMTAGANIYSNSWHDGRQGAGNPAGYIQFSVDVDTFTFNNEEHLVFGSSGNTGEEQGAPGTAKNAICVSASQTDLTNIGDGVPGPTADGRRKPDLVTVGCAIQSATVNTPCTVGPRSPCATSYATPHAAAAAALVRQYYTEGWYPTGVKIAMNAFVPSAALLKATMVASTLDMAPAGYPNNTEGWGLVRLDRALFFSGASRLLNVFDVRHAAGPTTGDDRTHQIDVSSNAEQLKIVMAFTDAPGTSGAMSTRVNDLDLLVTAPDGTQYLGNDFTNGVSTPNSASIGDLTEPVEVVVVNNPQAGRWTIEVQAFAVNVGSPGQGYAIAASANLTPPRSCFVASTVYADAWHPDVLEIRDWRDLNLHRRSMRTFARIYHRVGPIAARIVEHVPPAHRLLRQLLLPLLARTLRERRNRP